jgi:transposase-like protein
MRSTNLAPFGGNGGVVEVDETFIGQLKGVPKRRAFHHKMKVLALVDRDTRQARTVVIDSVNASTLMPIVLDNVAREARIMTDEHSGYRDVPKFFAGHGTTRHGRGEYVNFDDRSIHSNTVEGYLSIFKRGMKGVYQHCGEHHLHRYLAEFEFRYNNRVVLGCNDSDLTVAPSRYAAWAARPRLACSFAMTAATSSRSAPAPSWSAATFRCTSGSLPRT